MYLNFWQPNLQAGSSRDFRIMMINDYYQSREGMLVLTLEDAQGHDLARTEVKFQLAPLGQMNYILSLTVPAETSGKCILRARAIPDGAQQEPTTSRRKVTVVASTRK